MRGHAATALDPIPTPRGQAMTEVSSRRAELDPDPADRVHVTRLLRGFPELAAQPGDMDIDGLVGAAVGHAPDVSEQVTPGDHLAGVECQVVQQVELAPAQIQW